jgi:hypothetical protein
MRFRIKQSWRLPDGKKVLAAGTVVDTSDPKCPAKGLKIPFDAQPLDEESWREQLQLYGEQHKHLLGGGWQ